MGLEILGVRLIQPYSGASLHVWGSVISIFLGGICTGSFLGGALADRRPQKNLLSAILLIPSLMLLLSPVYARKFCEIVYSMDMDSRNSAMVMAGLLFFIPSVIAGAGIPFVLKLMNLDQSNIGSGAGRLYAFSTVGSIVGTLFTSFYLVGEIGVGGGMMISGAIFLSASILCRLL